MNLTLLTVGTRGDVQPFIALALELQARGATVRLAAPSEQRDLVTGFGVPFMPLRADYLQLAQSEEGQQAVRGNPRAALKLLREVVLPGTLDLLHDATAAAEGAEGLVFHPKALAGRHLAEALNIPAFVVATAPVLVPTRAFPAPATTRHLGPFNRWTYALPALSERPLAGIIRQWRQEVGLPTKPTPGLRMAGKRLLPVLHAHSRFLVPRPADWDEESHVTGFWLLPEDQLPPLDAELSSFLEAGLPPVVVGFGSMGVGNPQAAAELAAKAARQIGQRAVLIGLPDVPGDDVLSLSHAPHGRLYPRARGIVHHGGAGTTAASLHAGVPSVIVPHGLDQPFWAQRLQELGVGVHLPLKQLTAGTLAAALKQAGKQVTAAHTVQQLMQMEGGAAGAADLILQR